MGGLNINNTSQWLSSEYNNTIDDYGDDNHDDYYIDYYDDSYEYDYGFAKGFAVSWHIVSLIIFCFTLLLILVAFHRICSLVRNNHTFPVYIFNLLISDLVHICSQTISVHSVDNTAHYVFFNISSYFGTSSICFTLCLALERYLIIAHPLWYRFSHPIKISILISVLIWLLPFVFVLAAYFNTNVILFSVISHLLPLPLFIFFLAGAVRALSAAIHITSTEKQRIIGTLVLPVLTYSLIYLPYNLWALVEKIQNKNEYPQSKLELLFRFSPAANTILYVFITKGALDKLLAFLCCCKVDNNETNTISV